MAVDTQEANLYGVGRGAAQVWGTNRALAGLQEAQKQAQLRRQKEDAEIADQVAKINYDAARNEDLPTILDQYGKIKNTFTQLRGTQNTMERIKLQAKMNEQKAELSRSVNLSKQAATQIHDLGQLRLTHADDISDDFNPMFKTLSSTSTFDPKFTDHANTLSTSALVPKFDQQAYSKKLLDQSIENINGGKVMQEKNGKLTRQYQEVGSRLNEDNILKNVINAYTQDRKFQKYIHSNYKDMPVDQAVKQYAADLYVGNKDAYDKVKQQNVGSQWDERPDRFYEHYNYALKHPKANTFFMGTPQSMVIPYDKGKANVQMDNYIPISISKKNFAGSPFIDLKTGKEGGKLASSNDYEVVGVGNAPFIKSGDLKGAISQPNYVGRRPDNIENKPVIHVQMKDAITNATKDYFVPYDRLPENVKQSKSIQAVLKNFKPADKTSKSVTDKPAKSKKKDPLGIFN